MCGIRNWRALCTEMDWTGGEKRRECRRPRNSWEINQGRRTQIFAWALPPDRLTVIPSYSHRLIGCHPCDRVKNGQWRPGPKMTKPKITKLGLVPSRELGSSSSRERQGMWSRWHDLQCRSGCTFRYLRYKPRNGEEQDSSSVNSWDGYSGFLSELSALPYS